MASALSKMTRNLFNMNKDKPSIEFINCVENFLFNLPLPPRSVWIREKLLKSDAHALAVLEYSERLNYIKTTRSRGKVFIERYGWGICKPFAGDYK